MGLFDSLFGGNSKKQSGKVVTDQNVKSTAISSKASANSKQTGTVGAQTGTTATQQTQQTQTLAPEVQDLIISLIGTTSVAGGGGGATGDEAKTVADMLLERAGQTQEFVDQRKSAILTAAEKEGQRQVQATQTQAASGAGSSFNTLVQQAGQQANNDLLVQLASTEGQLDLAGREAETQALAQAFDALTKSGQLGASAGLENVRVVADLVNSLKGATSTTTGTGSTQTAAQTETQSTENQVQQLLELITQTQEGKSVQTSQAENNQGGSFNLIDLLPLLLEGD